MKSRDSSVTRCLCGGLVVRSVCTTRPRFRQGFVGLRCYVIANIPKLFVEKMLHPLMKNFHGRSHRSNNAATDDPLRQLQVMKAEQMYAFVEVEQSLRHVV